ncbi:hypothetical protein MNBD_CHLOROFLEXI01-1870 [hydrothermal vent metagenome]|uniref:Uncharacterized protein n=1 Tax=hydrothermal vent metagenome TaxID=652676 RepID=A0A3B0UUJ6_9ZZZZ
MIPLSGLGESCSGEPSVVEGIGEIDDDLPQLVVVGSLHGGHEIVPFGAKDVVVMGVALGKLEVVVGQTACTELAEVAVPLHPLILFQLLPSKVRQQGMLTVASLPLFRHKGKRGQCVDSVFGEVCVLIYNMGNCSGGEGTAVKQPHHLKNLPQPHIQRFPTDAKRGTNALIADI